MMTARSGTQVMKAIFQIFQPLHHRRICRWTVVWMGMLCFGASPAVGYVLKGPHILELLVQKLAGASTLQVEQKVWIDDPDLSGVTLELDETLRLVLPGQVRSDIRHEDGHRIHVRSQGHHLTVIDGIIADESRGRFDRYQDLLLYNSRHALHRALLIQGVDVGITSLGEMEDRIVYVVGAAYPDDSVSQLWVDKERLLPLRWINVFPSADGATEPERLEFVYRNWQDTDGVWYPMEIETFHNQQSIRRIRVTKVQANAVFEGELLNIDHLKTVFKEKETDSLTGEIPDADAGVDEVRKTLEDFRKKFEP